MLLHSSENSNRLREKEVIIFAVAMAIFGVIFSSLVVSFGLYLVDWATWQGFVAFILFQSFFIGISYELTEIILCIFLKPTRLPHCSSLQEYPPVALVMTVCDDIDIQAISRLCLQNYPNYEVFILDDSSDREVLSIVNGFQFRVIRRSNRDGFKAGNLNNWFKKFGENFEYVVVFDNDSYADKNLITQLIEYAEHPKNLNIAIFQSKVFPWPAKTFFEYLIGFSLPARMWILERTANQMGILLCFGHNYLVRSRAIREVGYFPEQVTAEDTALTLVLNAAGYSTKMVDVVSFASEPKNVFLYVQRVIRWAKQTVEIFRFPWKLTSIQLKITLGYYLYNYVIQSMYVLSLLFFSWAFKSPIFEINQIIDYFWFVKAYLSTSFIMFVVLAGVWLVIFSFRFMLIKITGKSWKDIFLHALLMSCAWCFYIFPMTHGLFQTLFGEKVIFNPTNTVNAKFHPSRFSDYLLYARVPIFYSAIILWGILTRNHLAIYGMPIIWVLVMTISPLVLWRSYKFVAKPSSVSLGDVQ